jgi:PIN domain nuclease of toxin-antitoxin system
LIVWQAIQENMTLISKDAEMPKYRVLGLKTLWR